MSSRRRRKVGKVCEDWELENRNIKESKRRRMFQKMKLNYVLGFYVNLIRDSKLRKELQVYFQKKNKTKRKKNKEMSLI